LLRTNLYLKLIQKHGIEYDIAAGLFSFDSKVIEWGKRLFEYCKIRSNGDLNAIYAQ